MIVITGATGNIGRRIADMLLSRGKQVRAISRSGVQLKPLVEKGAEAAVGRFEDSGFVRQAFQGATAVFAMIPPILKADDLREYQAQIGENIATAIETAGIRYAVDLSSLGAHLSEGSGILLGSHDQEQRLNRIEDLNVVHLRPAYFMENFLGSIGRIKRDNIFGSSLRGDIPLALVATQDIAQVASRYLLELNFSGKSVHDLLGERDLTLFEITKILGNAVGKPDLKYVQFPYQQVKDSMMSRGISESVADASIELSKALNENPHIFDSERTPEKTTPTSIEEFVDLFLTEYEKGSLSAR
jgi:uncharacterized protein YbjT (DUF2867 family)